MINFDFDKDCCGCTACASSCAKGAITMQRNAEGFLMPVIDKDKCVDCGLCDKACPHLNTSTDRSQFSLNSFKDKKAYLYYSKADERKDSASGAFVYDAMRKVVAEGGVACGCVWDENITAVHIISDKQEDLRRMQSSKYVQSNMQDSFREVKAALKSGRKVVFCGTPCQTAGLKTFLGKTDVSNLVSICLICHGVPSPAVWDAWKDIMERKYNGKLVDVNMRDKSYKGYATSYSKYTFGPSGKKESDESGKLKRVGMPTYLADPYIFLFTDNLYLRHSCDHCHYKAENNGADIIVGDFYASTEGAVNLGCSCMIAMNSKGEEFITSLGGVLKDSDFVQVGSVNSMLWSSSPEHPNRREFFNRFATESPSEKLFVDFLPFRFKVKKILNQMGVFSVVCKLIQSIKK